MDISNTVSIGSYAKLFTARLRVLAASDALDQNRLNNKPANLRWGSSLDHLLVDVRKSDKFDPGKVLEIRKQLMRGLPRPVLQRHYDISAGLLHCLAFGKIWKLGECIPDGFEDWQAMRLMPVAS